MKILLLGIGNILYADEGVGVHFVNYIKTNYKITNSAKPNCESGSSLKSNSNIDFSSNTITFMDGGTLAQALIPEIAKYDYLIVVDTVNATNVQAGEVYFFDLDQAPAEIDWQGSAHEVEMRQTLTMMEIVGDRPPTFILGVVPTIIEPMSLALTDKILNAIPTMEKILVNHLKELGFHLEKNNNIPITKLAENSFKVL